MKNRKIYKREGKKSKQQKSEKLGNRKIEKWKWLKSRNILKNRISKKSKKPKVEKSRNLKVEILKNSKIEKSQNLNREIEKLRNRKIRKLKN